MLKQINWLVKIGVITTIKLKNNTSQIWGENYANNTGNGEVLFQKNNTSNYLLKTLSRKPLTLVMG